MMNRINKSCENIIETYTIVRQIMSTSNDLRKYFEIRRNAWNNVVNLQQVIDRIINYIHPTFIIILFPVSMIYQ